MFSKKLGFALGGIIIFLSIVAFIMGKPPTKDKRLYPIIREYMPYKIENGLGGLKILKKDDPKFKEEPDAVNFYQRLQTLEREWAKNHLKISQNGAKLEILDSNKSVVKVVDIESKRELEFINRYFGVK